MKTNGPSTENSQSPDIEEEDIYAAMRKIPGYLDITPKDFKEIYIVAFQRAKHRMLTSITAKHIMSTPVYSVSMNTPLTEIAGLMANKRISGVPVVDDRNYVVGVISEKDFNEFLGLRKNSTLMELTQKYINGDCISVNTSSSVASDIMSHPAITVKPETPLNQILKKLAGRKINRVFVINEKFELIGIVTRHDIIRSPLIEEWSQKENETI